MEYVNLFGKFMLCLNAAAAVWCLYKERLAEAQFSVLCAICLAILLK